MSTTPGTTFDLECVTTLAEVDPRADAAETVDALCALLRECDWAELTLDRRQGAAGDYLGGTLRISNGAELEVYALIMPGDYLLEGLFGGQVSFYVPPAGNELVVLVEATPAPLEASAEIVFVQELVFAPREASRPHRTRPSVARTGQSVRAVAAAPAPHHGADRSVRAPRPPLVPIAAPLRLA